MTVLIEAEAKEIAELLTLLFTSQERLKKEKLDCKLQELFTEMKQEKAATETAKKDEWFPEDSLHGKIYDCDKSLPYVDSINNPQTQNP